MKILLLTTFVALATADVSHLLNQQPGYAYQTPLSSYGAPQASVLGGASNAVSYSSGGSLALPAASAGNFNGQSLSFTSGFPSNVGDGLTVQSYSNVPAGVAVSSTASPLNVDFSGGFVSSTPASVPSVNFVQYSQQQPALGNVQYSVSSTAAPAFGVSQFASDASLNSGFGSALSGGSSFGSSGSFGSSVVDSSAAKFGGIGGSISSGFGLSGGVSGSSSYAGKTSGGSLDESFGVVTDAASGASQSDVSKHLYFFAAPEEPEEEIQAKIDLPPVPPKKSYKIIFIKAPSYRLPSTINVPAQPQNEEKTLVYVLVKKPEVHPKVRYQGALPAKPSKPEVFFIKYKTQKEAEAAVADIQSKHGAQGQVIANLPAGVQLASQQAEAIAANAAAVATGESAGSFGGISAADFGSNAAANFGSSAGIDSSSVSVGSTGAGFETRFSGNAAQGSQGVSETTSFQLNIPVSSTANTIVEGSSGAGASGVEESSYQSEGSVAEQSNEVSGSAGAEEHVVNIGGAASINASGVEGHVAADESGNQSESHNAQVGFSTYGVPSV
ncbi:uncharacterized protein LOC126737637 [Anthonomus grandis grandis]|uniref:uncharacterized protein LOC126737637 n=1 Tax=Anthonomus grandis grandis TaxID=2921223 RepID=UPI00216585A0|nr:uncharacterized protein LOC126737637 [Anthonomus grandis grandis]